jgi:hypothetical protein
MADGKSNPFTQIGNTMAGNNFITNPGGSGSRGTGRSFVGQPSPSQTARDGVADRDNATAPAGGLVPKVQASSGGVGSIGNGAKPFRLGGG